MVSLLDDSVANLTRALEKNGMLDDTLIVFTSDVILKKNNNSLINLINIRKQIKEWGTNFR
jgi:hypothetical protein